MDAAIRIKLGNNVMLQIFRYSANTYLEEW